MKRKLLITDDNDVNLMLLQNMLSGEYDILKAKNGREALSVLAGSYNELSAVLLDLNMPIMDGFEVLEQIRMDRNLSRIPVIVATGSTDIRSEKKALSLGAQDYIQKPYDPDIICHRLANTIKLRETAAMVNALRRDRLTGLLTRETFFEQAALLIQAHEPEYYVISCFNINNFKVINDQYGNEKGDEVLRQIAAIFRRGFEPLGGLIGRIMADHFAALYPSGYAGKQEIAKIREAASVLDGSVFPISFSIGRYLIDDLSLSVSAMYDRAAMAETSVKGQFDINFGWYDNTMRERILQEQTIVNEMKQALASGQFEVWYQPQYNHTTGALIGAEALVRWKHPEKGLITPGVFIPVFERNGFIYALDKYVWEQVCILLRRWTEQGRFPLPVSVNISRYDISREDLIQVITGLVDTYGIPTSLLRLEITESMFAQSNGQVIRIVKELIALGFTVEIDDFGSGYSSLNTLKDVPAQIVKLDMKFLDDAGDSGRGRNIIESVVCMIKRLGLSLIAEGVETAEQANYLKSIGCSYVQGYLYAKPMPVAAYEVLSACASKDEKPAIPETAETLDGNAFLDSKSMDTLKSTGNTV